MSMKPIHAAIAGGLLILSACTNTTQTSSPTGTQATATSPSNSTQTASAAAVATPAPPTGNSNLQQLNSGNFQPDPLDPGQPTGTVVGKKVEELRADLTQL